MKKVNFLNNIIFIGSGILLIGLVLCINFYLWNVQVDKIGNSFSGLLGPIISFFGAVIVYKSFQAQVQANTRIEEEIKLRNQELKIQNIKFLFDLFKSEFDSFEFNGISSGKALIEISKYFLSKIEEDLMEGKLEIDPFQEKIKGIFEILAEIVYSIQTLDENILPVQKRSLKLLLKYFFKSEFSCFYYWSDVINNFDYEKIWEEVEKYKLGEYKMKNKGEANYDDELNKFNKLQESRRTLFYKEMNNYKNQFMHANWEILIILGNSWANDKDRVQEILDKRNK